MALVCDCVICVTYIMLILKLWAMPLSPSIEPWFWPHIQVLNPGLDCKCLVLTLVLSTSLVYRFAVLKMQLMQVLVLRQCALNCRHGT